MRNLNATEAHLASGGFDDEPPPQPPCVPPKTTTIVPVDPGTSLPSPAQVVYVGNEAPLRARMTEFVSPDDVWQPIP